METITYVWMPWRATAVGSTLSEGSFRTRSRPVAGGADVAGTPAAGAFTHPFEKSHQAVGVAALRENPGHAQP